MSGFVNGMMRGVMPGLAALLLVLLPLPRAQAQLGPRPPERPSMMPPLEGETPLAGIDPKPGAQAPLELAFTDEYGKRVVLGDYFASGKPVILTLNYYECPQLCGLMLNGVADAIREMGLALGKDYQVVTISFDPSETYSLARFKKNSYTDYLSNTPGVTEGWHFLTGESEPIAALAEAVGFRYAWVEGGQQWTHPNAIMLLDGEGKVFRYLYPESQYQGAMSGGFSGGYRYHPQTLRRSLVETSGGEIGTVIDGLVLTCFAFDPHKGKYSQLAMSAMQLGGAMTAIAVVALVVGFLLWERMRARAAGPRPQDLPGKSIDGRG